ncbi:recombinase family protein [Bacillus sp. 2205SS5-2]|uniref:recombinase family protein n=1 Tax=Bacillus sp. 2205SS5-2 TaxID=3109031 RepID=UPI003004E87A
MIFGYARVSTEKQNLDMQLDALQKFSDMDVHFVSITDNIDTSTAIGKFFFRTMASIAELERDIIRERTKSGLQAARSRGKKGGRPTKREDKVEVAIKMYKSKDYSIKEITEMTGLSKTTLYRYLEKA